MALGSDRAQRTVNRLKDDVTSGRWPVNSRIPTEAALAAEYGVGRSTMREAIRSLAHLGLLEPAPGRGTFVRSLNPVEGVLAEFVASHTWEDILEVRRAIEVAAADGAARRGRQVGVQALTDAHDDDLNGVGSAERGKSPGQFHSLVVEMADNRLLAALHAGLSSVLRDGLRSGALTAVEDSGARHRDHGALLAAISAGNPAAAAAIASAHADVDLTVSNP